MPMLCTAMRAFAAGLALASLLLAPLAAAEPEPCPARLCADVGYPGPGFRVVVHEHPDCAVHAVFWEGAWMSAADASRWFWSDRSLAGAEAIDDRAHDAAALLFSKAITVAADGAARGPDFAADPLQAPLWALATVGDEDVCVLGVVEVTTGLQGP